MVVGAQNTVYNKGPLPSTAAAAAVVSPSTASGGALPLPERILPCSPSP
jgi:hypothetical protein